LDSNRLFIEKTFDLEIWYVGSSCQCLYVKVEGECYSGVTGGGQRGAAAPGRSSPGRKTAWRKNSWDISWDPDSCFCYVYNNKDCNLASAGL